MMYEYFAFLVILVFWAGMLLWYRSKNNNLRQYTFSASDGADDSKSTTFYQLLVNRYMSQQKWAFGLLVVSICLTFILIYIMVLAAINTEIMVQVDDLIKLGGSSGISFFSAWLYTDSTSRLESAINSLVLSLSEEED